MINVIGICRFSVVTHENMRDWKIGADADWEGYKQTVLDDRKIEAKCNLISNVTLPSLDAAVSESGNQDTFMFLILFSEGLSDAMREKLASITEKYQWCKLVRVEFSGSVSGAVRKELTSFDLNSIYATFRLDDDDALNRCYLRELNNYIDKHFIGHAISFPHGLNGLYDYSYERYIACVKVRHRNIGLGLALISSLDDKHQHILYDKRHQEIDRRHPTITVPSRKPMFLRSIHEFSDITITKTDRIERFLKKNGSKGVNAKLILRNFGISDRVI